jgi:hypothetical protein
LIRFIPLPRGVLAGTVPSDHLATDRVGRGLLRCVGVRRPGVRSGGSFLGLERSRSTTHPRRGLPPRRKLLRARSAIGRVAGCAGALEAAEGRCRRLGAGQRLGGATGARWSRRRWTRQQRLPSRSGFCQPFAATGIHTEIALTTASGGIPLIVVRRAGPESLAISGGIPTDGPLSAPKNDPRETAISGGLVTTDWTGYGDDSSLR